MALFRERGQPQAGELNGALIAHCPLLIANCSPPFPDKIPPFTDTKPPFTDKSRRANPELSYFESYKKPIYLVRERINLFARLRRASKAHVFTESTPTGAQYFMQLNQLQHD
ncbi:MAG: hypothetical protein H6581_14800 [Bacteroidia bacterium]|nr:hypothetical protein [Bacteroidia bacterium]